MESVWRKAGFEAPNILTAINEKTGERFIVIEDDSTIIKLMNKRGQTYAVAAFRCEVKQDKNNEYYACGEPLHAIGCSKVEGARDRFVFDTLRLKYL
jgi:hypothetical protein